MTPYLIAGGAILLVAALVGVAWSRARPPAQSAQRPRPVQPPPPPEPRARSAPRARPDPNDPGIRLYLDNALAECVAAFERRDYGATKLKAVSVLYADPTSLLAGLLLVASAQRLDDKDAEKIFEEALVSCGGNSNWRRLLVVMTAGKMEAEEEMCSLAPSDLERIRFRFSAGLSLLTRRNFQGAVAQLDQALAISHDCPERRLAQAERELASGLARGAIKADEWPATGSAAEDDDETAGDDDPADWRRELDDLCHAFTDRDYKACNDLFKELMRWGKQLDRSVPPDEWLLAEMLNLLALLRQGFHKISPELVNAMVGVSLLESSRHQKLRRLVYGSSDIEADLAAFLKTATGAEDPCRAQFYAAARLATDGKVDVARRLLDDCVATGASCLERDLARRERAALKA